MFRIVLCSVRLFQLPPWNIHGTSNGSSGWQDHSEPSRSRPCHPGTIATAETLSIVVEPSVRSRQWVQRLTVDGKRRDLGLGGYPYGGDVEGRRGGQPAERSGEVLRLHHGPPHRPDPPGRRDRHPGAGHGREAGHRFKATPGDPRSPGVGRGTRVPGFQRCRWHRRGVAVRSEGEEARSSVTGFRVGCQKFDLYKFGECGITLA